MLAIPLASIIAEAQDYEVIMYPPVNKGFMDAVSTSILLFQEFQYQ